MGDTGSDQEKLCRLMQRCHAVVAAYEHSTRLDSSADAFLNLVVPIVGLRAEMWEQGEATGLSHALDALSQRAT